MSFGPWSTSQKLVTRQRTEWEPTTKTKSEKKQVKLLISYWSELFFIQRVNILRGFFALNKCRCYQVDSASLNKGALGHQQIYKPMSTYSCHFNSNSQIFSCCNFAAIFRSFRSTSFFCLVSCYTVKILTTVCSISIAFFLLYLSATRSIRVLIFT